MDDFPPELVPSMPCVAARRQKHRSKTQHSMVNACVARPVSKKEVESNPKALRAKQAEWDRLRAVPRPDGGIGVWNESLVAEWRDVKRKALKEGKKVHIGRIFDILVEKNSELPEDDPRRKFKGRAVFGGDNVRDEAGNWAIFQDLGSCPAPCQATLLSSAMQNKHTLKQCSSVPRRG